MVGGGVGVVGGEVGVIGGGVGVVGGGVGVGGFYHRVAIHMCTHHTSSPFHMQPCQV